MINNQHRYKRFRAPNRSILEKGRWVPLTNLLRCVLVWRRLLYNAFWPSIHRHPRPKFSLLLLNSVIVLPFDENAYSFVRTKQIFPSICQFPQLLRKQNVTLSTTYKNIIQGADFNIFWVNSKKLALKKLSFAQNTITNM